MKLVEAFILCTLTLFLSPVTSQQIYYTCEEKECDLDLTINGTVCERSSGNCSCACLNAIPQKSGGCWVSGQCQYRGSTCLSAIGESLEIIDLRSWKEANTVNGIRHPAPGSCECSSRFWHDSFRKACIRRVIGSRCRTPYQCAARVPHSTCVQRRCICSHDYEYQDKVDSCFRVLGVNHTDEVCLGQHCSLLNEASTVGLIFCLCATVFFFWCCSCCCSCCCSSKEERRKTPEEVYLGKDSY